MRWCKGSTKKRTDLRENLKEIISLYQSGITAEKIGKMKFASKRLILQLLRESGINRRIWRTPKGRIPWNKNKRSPQTSGDKNGNWKGGITSLNQNVHHLFEYREWIRDIFKRDDFTCVKCKKRGGNIEADHYPILFSEILKKYQIKSVEEAIRCSELWNIDNGRTLCLKCHNRTKQVRSRFKRVGVTIT